MPVKSTLLVAAGVLVMAAIAYLFVDVRAAAAPVPQKKLDEAREKAKTTARAQATAPSASNMDDPWARAKDSPSDVKLGAGTVVINDETAKDEPEPTPAPEYRPATPGEASTPDLYGDPRLDVSNAKDEANRLYDKQDFDGAIATAMKVLEKDPGDVRMIRVIVSSACQLGDAERAKQFYSELPAHDQSQMARRCSRMNITFE